MLGTDELPAEKARGVLLSTKMHFTLGLVSHSSRKLLYLKSISAALILVSHQNTNATYTRLRKKEPPASYAMFSSEESQLYISRNN